MRVDGYAGIEDYAVLSDGRTIALVALDGSVDWLSVPTMDGTSVFGALLDAERGGSFWLRPQGEFEVSRRYVPHTNVLETTFAAAHGRLRVREALTLQDGGLVPWIELARAIECLEGSVRIRWECRPRFDFGRTECEIEERNGIVIARGGRDYLALRAWDAGEPQHTAGTIAGETELGEGDTALLSCICVDDEPIPCPPREEVEQRLDGTCKAWRRWVARNEYDGPWKREVERSALALKALTYSPSGAMAAAATTSLPEIVGGERNYDYRFSWIRDSAFAIDALSRLGFREQVHESLSWLLAATEPTHPRMEPLYTLGGGVPRRQSELPLAGWRGTRPVRKGNSATGQLQPGTYGDLLETVRLYVHHGNLLDSGTATRIVEICNLLARTWRNEDSGFWELPDRRHYTISKLQAWGAFDRALGLVEDGEVEVDDETRTRWQRTQEQIRDFVETRCWSDARRSYTFHADADTLDASLLLNARIGFLDPAGERFGSTIDAIREELSAGGPLLYRFSELRGREGAFVACSFWLVTALVRAGRDGEAREQMDAMVELGNDVGLFSEQIDPETLTFRGNTPQALSHLALIDAATILHEVETSGPFSARAAEEVSR
ncbi:MAG TPA: glycoside hydrolase family 15 protein [Gaiellaceae bacterium]|nr:glycoside hydrolase family 15 protein [Gaiellaceae bacterium]